ncbi:MAG: ABC transporter ATP-binding protein/permease [Chitinophagaceae bacterium]|jgi:ATP-binding cassette subfamily B protein|nr:ABC transporter ATP-binding protein/permease [Chitinophagaceae bacterium]
MSEQQKKKVLDFKLLRRVMEYVKPYRVRFFSSIVLAVLLALFTVVRPLLIQLTIDKATGKEHDIPKILQWILGKGNLSDATKFIIAITIFQIVFLFIETFVRFIFSFFTSWMGQSIVRDMRLNIFAKILNLNLRQFDTTPIGTLTTRTVNDIESINDVFSDGLIPIVADLLSIVAVLFVMFWVSWELTLMALIPFPFLILATYFFKESVNKSFIRVRNAVAALNAFVQEHISGMSIVQAFAAENREEKKFKRINREHRNANIKAIFAYSIFFPIVEIVSTVSIGILVWWIADKKLDAGLLVSFILFLNLIFRPLRVIADKFNVIQMGMVAAERIFKILDNPDFIPPSPKDAHAPAHLKGKIDFKNVSFAYNEPNYVLKNISFEVKSGETIALVGHTGSGKTSIISLLNRLYAIQKGSIEIDDVNIYDYDLDTLRRNIGVVLQDVFLFSGSILDNITLYNPSITEAEVIAVAKLIGVHDFIMRLPGGYHFNVMERGNTLSMGQRQLISFIRALLYNPAILILDGATSSIDTESELLIQYAIEKLISGRTSIVIAHRLSTIRKADKIIVLDNGEIKEIGTHAELLANTGFYAKLYNIQFEKEKSLVEQV